MEKFENASASIPLRQIDRAFESADIRRGEDPGGGDGARRVQFRRFVAGVDQNDPQQLDRLGVALGALIAQVADSKVDFLVRAAASDGFAFADGAFRAGASRSFTMTRVEEFSSIGDRVRTLALLAHDRPHDATAGASELVESVCRVVLGEIGKRAPRRSIGLTEMVKATLDACVSDRDGANDSHVLVAIIAELVEVPEPLSIRRARLVAGAAGLVANFIAEAHAERLRP